jgi:hypothetical protein
VKFKKPIFFIAISISLTNLLSPAFADTQTTALACPQPASAPSDAGTLVLAAQSQQLTSTEWGIRQGCFKKYGLTIKTTPISSSTIGFAGLISKTYDLTATTPVNLIQAKINGGFPGLIVAPKHGYSAEELIRARQEPFFPGELLLQTVVIVKSDSKIKSWKDLNKKKIAIQNVQGADHAGVLLAMRESGIRNPELELLTTPGPQMIDALNRGDVDAVVANDPIATTLIIGGARIVGYPQAYFAQAGSSIVYISTSEIASSKSRTLKIFQKATLEINKLLNKKENEESFRKVIAEVTKIAPEAAAKARLPLMMEKNVTINELSYIPSKLKKVGFLKGRFELGPILFR